MKNFSELLATNPQLTVTVNDTEMIIGLHDFLIFKGSDTVTIDGIEILPRYRYLADNDVLTINEPFYCWYHRVSDQGWLLKPY